MKKLFTSLLATSAVATFAACGKTDAKEVSTDKETTKVTKTTVSTPAITKGKVAKDSFKVGYAGSNPVFTKNLKDALTTYTQDITNTSKTGEGYFNLPSGLFLLSSDNFNSYLRETAEYKNQVAKLKKYLLDNVRFGKDNTPHGYYISSANYGKSLDQDLYYQYFNYAKFNNTDNPNSLVITENVRYLNKIIIILDNTNSDFAGAKATFDKIFSDEKIAKLYEVLQSKTVNKKGFTNALDTVGINYRNANTRDFTPKTSLDAQGKAQRLYINANPKVEIRLSGFDKTFGELKTEFEIKTKMALEDKTQLAAKKIDALFVQVTNGVENSAEVYKTVVEQKAFGASKLFFVGNEAKSQSGASSKVFAGKNISTASFNKYAAAYVGGFQAAVGTIKYSSSEDTYEETITSFIIGSTSDSEAKKKAFAFRRGVEAAAAHSAYSKYLKVKFVSKTEDSSKSSKKLYREVSEWKAKEDSKSKLYEFASSDTFSDADRRVIYLAGTSARDWIGSSSDISEEAIDKFEANNDYGLIGALYNYRQASAEGEFANSLTSKTYAKGVWVVLDKATSKTAADDSVVKTGNGDLSQIPTANQGQINFERHQVKFYGAIGKQGAGTAQYASAALKGLYMGGPNYMLGKHTIFGAPLDNSLASHVRMKTEFGSTASLKDSTIWTAATPSQGTTKGVWSAKTGKDSADKAKNRFNTSLNYAWEKEISEAELIKTSPWLK